MILVIESGIHSKRKCALRFILTVVPFEMELAHVLLPS